MLNSKRGAVALGVVGLALTLTACNAGPPDSLGSPQEPSPERGERASRAVSGEAASERVPYRERRPAGQKVDTLASAEVGGTSLTLAGWTSAADELCLGWLDMEYSPYVCRASDAPGASSDMLVLGGQSQFPIDGAKEQLYWGFAPPLARTVRFEYANKTVDVAVSPQRKPQYAGRSYYWVLLEHLSGDVTVVALDDEGREIARRAITARR